MDAQAGAELVEVAELFVLGFDGVRTVVANGEMLQIQTGQSGDTVWGRHGFGFHAPVSLQQAQSGEAVSSR
jgi:hypothetical protein